MSVAVWLAPATASADPTLDARVREEFKAGAALVEQSEWASALAAFERSRALREHALTLYNIGVCQRFLGRYTLAATTLRAALARGEATTSSGRDGTGGSNELPEMFRDQAKAYLDEIERKLARLTVRLSPPEATTALDGRPVAVVGDDLVAGIAAPGEGKRVGRASFVVVVDPGAHVLTFQLEGHDTIEVRRELKPGAPESLDVSLTKQNGELQIDADRAESVVRVDNVDVGLTPITVTRPPGRHLITVKKEGFVTYGTAVTLAPGQHARLTAELPVERTPLTKRWWFWSGALAVVATGVLVTYVATRKDPAPPAYETGSTGWLVPLP